MNIPSLECPVCGSAAWNEITPEDKSFLLFQCPSCQCYQVDPEKRPVEHLYDGDYYTKESAQRLKGIFHLMWRFSFSRRAKFLLRSLPAQAVVCDIGCERGELLHFLKRAGHTVAGTQLSTHAANFARDNFGIDVFVGELPAAAFSDNFFDAVFMFHVLEHLPDPNAYLLHIHQILRPAGILWIEVPNAGSWTARMGRKKWLHHDPEHHFWSFNKEGLIHMLEKHGFTVEQTYHQSLKYGPIGCLQTWLNFLPGQRDLLFQMIRGGLSRGSSPLVLKGLHVILAIILAPAACVVSILESFSGNGVIILVKASKIKRKAESAPC